MSNQCFKCGRPGHWARDCDSRNCRKCAVPLDLHAAAGDIECAWRGGPCTVCGFPPHPDGKPSRRNPFTGVLEQRCDRYAHPADNAEDREIRSVTEWQRDADPDTFYRRPVRA